jgi:hypothetical protein
MQKFIGRRAPSFKLEKLQGNINETTVTFHHPIITIIIISYANEALSAGGID